MSAGGRAYFGGTFDPPHLGHIILASEAIYQLGLEQINWIITPDPPHKKGRVITPQEHRLEMLKRVIDRYQGFNISEVDMRRPPPHYAADTVEILKDQDPDHELVYLIGEDSLCDLPDWHQPDRFLSKVDQLAVYSRTGYQADLDQIGMFVQHPDIHHLISSSQSQ